MPDSPARAIRLTNSQIMLIASNITNIPLIGNTFQDLRPACDRSSKGGDNPDPLAFNDRVWLQAIAPLGASEIYGLASEEYAGSRHPGRCEVTGGACWYSSIVGMIANVDELKFRVLPFPARVVATSPIQYDPHTIQRSGVFFTTNIVYDGNFAMFMAYIEGVRGQPNGMCLFRAPRDNLAEGWRALYNDVFRVRLNSSKGIEEQGPGAVCEIVVRDDLRGLVRVGTAGPWVAVFMRPTLNTFDRCLPGGVFYRTSLNLRQWSLPTLLLQASAFVGQKGAGIYFQYPSLIDHASESPVFDTSGGAMYLYLVRYNLWPDRRQGGDRDLVRIPIEVR